MKPLLHMTHEKKSEIFTNAPFFVFFITPSWWLLRFEGQIFATKFWNLFLFIAFILKTENPCVASFFYVANNNSGELFVFVPKLWRFGGVFWFTTLVRTSNQGRTSWIKTRWGRVSPPPRVPGVWAPRERWHLVGMTRWWFQRFFMFIPIWGRFPFWLILFKWVETTN